MRNKRLTTALACIFLISVIYGSIFSDSLLTSTAKTIEQAAPAKATAAKLEPAAEIPNFGSRLLPKKKLQATADTGEGKQQAALKPATTAKPKAPQIVKPKPKPSATTPIKTNPPATKKTAAPVPVKKPAPPKVTAPGKPRPVYLTFDDGPHPVSGQILDVLKMYNAKATFFLLEPNMTKYPAAVKRMAASGHALGLHGVTHDKGLFYKSSSSILSEMNQAKKTVKKLTGKDTVLIRTPFGSSPHMTPAYKKAVMDTGYKMWDWTVDSRDWHYRNSQYIDAVIEQVEKQKKGSEPIVILLHERPETLEHLPKLMDYLKKQNFLLQPLTEAMQPVQFK